MIDDMNADSIFMMVIWVALALVGISIGNVLITSHKLYGHLMDAHYDRWRHITSVGGMGPGMANTLRGLDYLFSDQDDDDPQVVRLRAAVKRSLLLLAGVLVAAAVAVATTLVMLFVLEASK